AALLDGEGNAVDRANGAVTAAENAAPRRKVLAKSGGFEDGGHAMLPVVVVASAPAACAASQQRTLCPVPMLNCGGASTAQRASAAGQRGAKAQPGGMADRSGGCPSIAVSRARLSVMRGIEPSSALV